MGNSANPVHTLASAFAGVAGGMQPLEGRTSASGGDLRARLTSGPGTPQSALGQLGAQNPFGPRPGDPTVPRPVPSTNGGFGGAMNPIISPKDAVVAAPRSSSALGNSGSWGPAGPRQMMGRGSGTLDSTSQVPDWLAVGTFAGMSHWFIITVCILAFCR